MRRDSGVGVVIPAYNCARYIGEAIESVLNQTRPVERIVVIDDGSTDDTGAEIRRLKGPVDYVYRDNAGIGAARNEGVHRLDSEYIAFLDADDYWSVDKTEHQLAALEYEGLDAVFGEVVEFRDGRQPELSKRGHAANQTSGGYIASSMLIRHDSFLQIGPFRTDTKLGEFVDWFARFREAGLSHLTLDRPVLYRRIHADNTGILDRSRRRDYHRVLKAALDRRRDGGG